MSNVSTTATQGQLNAVDQSVELGVQGHAGTAFQVRGTWTGTLTFQCSVDGQNWQALLVVPSNTAAGVTTATANGVWQSGTAGVRVARVLASAWTSGTAFVEIVTSAAAPGNAQGGAASVTIADGDDASLGLTTDANVTGDNTGTVQAKLRGINRILASVWDSVNNWLKVQVQGTVTVSSKTALTANAPTTATVGVASAEALASNASRKGLIIVNTSANRVSFGIGATAVLDSGVTLTGQGTSWSMDEYDFATGAINAIASAASSVISIQEFQ